MRHFSAASEFRLDPELKGQVEAAFDRAFYSQRNPDVIAAGFDPLEHFLTFGWREGRDPSPDFSVEDYRDLNPEVTSRAVNPFLHFVRQGRAEGRRAKRKLGFRHEILARQAPMEARLRAARAAARDRVEGAAGELIAALAAPRAGGLHLTFSQDDYTANLGGLQLCLQQEARRFAAMDVDHLHLFPANAFPMVRPAGEGDLLGLLRNGQFLGCFTAATVAEAFEAALRRTSADQRSFAIHSMLGHTSADVLSILSGAGLREGFFWLHDFASLCAGFHLMRNDVADCAAPPPSSAACGLCIYGPYRAGHIAEHMALFQALSLTVVAPSHSALQTWRESSAFPHAGTQVLPHVQLTPRASASQHPEGPLRVAYLGMPVAHKGWPVFQDLAQRFKDDPRYRFLHLGKSAGAAGVEFHEAAVSPGRPLAMKEEAEQLEIDIALVWPLCRETFGLTAYEAAAAGAAIITHPDTGNVAAFVESGGPGLVAADEAELGALFERGEVLALSRAHRRAVVSDLTFSGLTADLLPAPATADA